MVQDFSSKSIVKITPQCTAEYDVRVDVRDSTGKTVTKMFSLTVNNTLNNTSTIPTNKLPLGETLTINASAENGTGVYRYKVKYKRTDDTNWTVVQNYDTNSTIDLKPEHTGSYKLMVIVKDSSGMIVQKTFAFKVTSSIVNTTTVSAQSVNPGDKFIFKRMSRKSICRTGFPLQEKVSTCS